MTRVSLLIVAFLGLSACQDAESLRVDCDEGDAIACNDLGVMYQSGEGAPQHVARALSLYQQACDGEEIAIHRCTPHGPPVTSVQPTLAGLRPHAVHRMESLS